MSRRKRRNRTGSRIPTGAGICLPGQTSTESGTESQGNGSGLPASLALDGYVNRYFRKRL